MATRSSSANQSYTTQVIQRDRLASCLLSEVLERHQDNIRG